MMAAPFASERLAMRPLSVDDAPALHLAYGDEALMRRLSSGPHATLDETIAYLTPRVDRDAWRGWAMVRNDDGRTVGTLSAITRRRGLAEIGYLLAREHWQQGFAREAVSALIDQLLAEGHRRVFADTDPDNAASIAFLERLGFRREGLLHAEWETHIGVRDSVILGLVKAVQRFSTTLERTAGGRPVRA